MNNREDIRSMTRPELDAACADLGLPRFRSGQIWSWLHQKNAFSFSEMTNLSKDLRRQLADRFVLDNVEIAAKFVSKLDGTIKYVYRLKDGETIESVLMKYKYGYSVCISTQVGCNMKCRFCASTIDGCVRSLNASEMLAQVYMAERDTGERVSHVVLMGMGEPLMNYDNVLRFLQLITDDTGKNISARHISVSTCGIVPRIYDLMKLHPQFTLSVSLHAPNDTVRSQIMPVNRKWNVEELLEACRAYTETTSRRISFEYAMMSGVNDSDACARELADRLEGMLCHVNLIPANEVRENDYTRSTDARLRAFSKILENRGIPTTVRRTLGPDINASCGQLRRKLEKEHT
ncbi:MAG: 23S rRNA (adenine(2503)-C(2))-methyltransferase RlmN [Acutalibacteraceae bacterium]